MTPLDDVVSLEILWNRLISIVDEASVRIKRAAFSSIVRESADFACVLLDERGNSLAQSTYTVPSFIGTAPSTTKRMLQVFPAEMLSPGDILITNDPWDGTGHLPDVTVVAPIFRQGKLLGFGCAISHLPDIGGRPFSTEANDVFEEGLRIPISKLYRKGDLNEDLFGIILANVRLPDQVRGDLGALSAATQALDQKVNELIVELEIDDFLSVAERIQGICEKSMREAIKKVPDGEYQYTLISDGFDNPATVKVKVTIRESDVYIDYTGTSRQIDRGVNSVPAYTFAYSAYAVKCMLDPDTPNNEGAFRPIHVFAPEGCFLNPLRPAPVGARNLTGHLIPDSIWGALSDALPERALAETGCPCWNAVLHGVNEKKENFGLILFFNGGQGASAQGDGMSTISFPTNVSCCPVEIAENIAPILFLRKEFRAGSGGGGLHHGGLGQVVEWKSLSASPIHVHFLTDKIKNSAKGRKGGGDGGKGLVEINGKSIGDPRGHVVVERNDTVEMALPGGGGFGKESRTD